MCPQPACRVGPRWPANCSCRRVRRPAVSLMNCAMPPFLSHAEPLSGPTPHTRAAPVFSECGIVIKGMDLVRGALLALLAIFNDRARHRRPLANVVSRLRIDNAAQRDVGQPFLAADPLSSGSSRLKAGCGELPAPHPIVKYYAGQDTNARGFVRHRSSPANRTSRYRFP